MDQRLERNSIYSLNFLTTHIISVTSKDFMQSRHTFGALRLGQVFFDGGFRQVVKSITDIRLMRRISHGLTIKKKKI